MAALLVLGVVGLAAAVLFVVRSIRAERRRLRRREKRLLHDAEARRHWQALQQTAPPDGV